MFEFYFCEAMIILHRWSSEIEVGRRGVCLAGGRQVGANGLDLAWFSGCRRTALL